MAGRHSLTRSSMLLYAVMLAIGLAPAATAQLTDLELRGKRIYTRGEGSSDQPIQAVLGDDPTGLPASLMSCSTCHGYNGHGKPEGGITPSNITWPVLTKPYGLIHENGRRHPAYDEAALKRAVTMGFDPAGNSLNEVMPKYRMAYQDLAALVAYLKTLGSVTDPGVSDGVVRIGTLLPPRKQMPGLRADIETILRAFFDRINRERGINGRSIELHVRELPENPADVGEEAARFVRTERIFAMVASYMAGVEDRVGPVLRSEALPSVGPFTLLPAISSPLDPYTFYLDSGLIGATQELTALARSKLTRDDARLAILSSPDQPYAAAAAQAEAASRKQDWAAVKQFTLPDSGHLADWLPGAVLVLRPAALAAPALQAISATGLPHFVMIPGSLVGPAIFDLPARFEGRIAACYSVLPNDYSRDAINEFRELVPASKLSGGNRVLQIQTFEAAKLLMEGLRRAGRDLSREALVEALERCYEFPTGVSPPLTYGPARRAGTACTHMVRLNLSKKQLQPMD